MVLMCDVCRQDISSSTQNATICLLPCFHKYCEQCKARLFSTARPQNGPESRVSCKLCNQQFLLNVLYDYCENQIEKIFCLHCNIKNKATVEWRCKSCQDRYLCAQCSQPHYHSGHELEPVMKPSLPVRSQCSIHANILATHLCSCQTRLCEHCLCTHANGQFIHPHEHRFPYTTLAEQARGELDTIRRDSQRDYERMSRLSEMINRNKHQTRVQACQARTAIANDVLELVNALIRRGNDLVARVDSVEEARQAHYAQMEQEHQHWLDRLRKIESFSENALLTIQQDHPGVWSASMFAQSAMFQLSKRRDLVKSMIDDLERPSLIGYQHESIGLMGAIRSFGLMNLDGVPKMVPQTTPQDARMFSIANGKQLNPHSSSSNSNSSTSNSSPIQRQQPQPHISFSPMVVTRPPNALPPPPLLIPNSAASSSSSNTSNVNNNNLISGAHAQMPSCQQQQQEIQMAIRTTGFPSTSSTHNSIPAAPILQIQIQQQQLRPITTTRPSSSNLMPPGGVQPEIIAIGGAVNNNNNISSSLQQQQPGGAITNSNAILPRLLQQQQQQQQTQCAFSNSVGGSSAVAATLHHSLPGGSSSTPVTPVMNNNTPMQQQLQAMQQRNAAVAIPVQQQLQLNQQQQQQQQQQRVFQFQLQQQQQQIQQKQQQLQIRPQQLHQQPHQQQNPYQVQCSSSMGNLMQQHQQQQQNNNTFPVMLAPPPPSSCSSSPAASIMFTPMTASHPYHHHFQQQQQQHLPEQRIPPGQQKQQLAPQQQPQHILHNKQPNVPLHHQQPAAIMMSTPQQQQLFEVMDESSDERPPILLRIPNPRQQSLTPQQVTESVPDNPSTSISLVPVVTSLAATFSPPPQLQHQQHFHHHHPHHHPSISTLTTTTAPCCETTLNHPSSASLAANAATPQNSMAAAVVVAKSPPEIVELLDDDDNDEEDEQGKEEEEREKEHLATNGQQQQKQSQQISGGATTETHAAGAAVIISQCVNAKTAFEEGAADAAMTSKIPLTPPRQIKPQCAAADSTVTFYSSNNLHSACESPSPLLNHNSTTTLATGTKRKPPPPSLHNESMDEEEMQPPPMEKRAAAAVQNIKNNNTTNHAIDGAAAASNVNNNDDDDDECSVRSIGKSPPSDVISTTTAENGGGEEEEEEEEEAVVENDEKGGREREKGRGGGREKEGGGRERGGEVLRKQHRQKCRRGRKRLPESLDSPNSLDLRVHSSPEDNVVVVQEQGAERTSAAARSKNGCPTGKEESGSKKQSDDFWDDYCYVCSQGCDETTGSLGCCESCPRVFHARCHVPKIVGLMEDLPDDWRCSICLPCESLTHQSSQFGDREQLLCAKVFLACFVDNSQVEIFVSEVPASETDYHMVIKRPIWLQAIAEKINTKSFANVLEFLENMNLVFCNFSTFNPPNDPLISNGKSVYVRYMQAVKQHIPVYQNHIWIYVSLYNGRYHNNNNNSSSSQQHTNTSTSTSAINNRFSEDGGGGDNNNNNTNRQFAAVAASSSNITGKKCRRAGSKAKSQTPA